MESITKTPIRKIGVVVVWMGKLPTYFPTWVRSLEKNDAFDFFLFTDQSVDTNPSGTPAIPDNLTIVRMSFSEVRALVAAKLSLRVNMPHAYKFCDFKPTYGEVFSDYLAGYEFWGCCDIDLLFGNLKKFITDDLLLSNKKIFSRGHLTLYKNEPAINAAYRSSKIINYKRALESQDYCLFDEWHGVHRIFEELGIGQYNKDVMGDIKALSARLVCTNIRNYNPQIFVWEQGDVKQYFIEEGKLKSIELAYIHFQKRRISLPDPNVYSSKAIILNPRALLPYNEPVTIATVKEYDRSDYQHYLGSQVKRIKKRLASFNKETPSFNKTLLESNAPL